MYHVIDDLYDDFDVAIEKYRTGEYTCSEVAKKLSAITRKMDKERRRHPQNPPLTAAKVSHILASDRISE